MRGKESEKIPLKAVEEAVYIDQNLESEADEFILDWDIGQPILF